MFKYEYKVFIHSGVPKPTELLNEYGKEGWRLVSTSPVNNTVCYVMERPLPLDAIGQLARES